MTASASWRRGTPRGVRLYTRNRNDFTKRFPLVVSAVATLAVRSCPIDGEAIVSDEDGLAVFELIRSFRHDRDAVLCAFDLLDLDGKDLRRMPIERRKQTLAICRTLAFACAVFASAVDDKPAGRFMIRGLD